MLTGRPSNHISRAIGYQPNGRNLKLATATDAVAFSYLLAVLAPEFRLSKFFFFDLVVWTGTLTNSTYGRIGEGISNISRKCAQS